MRCTRIRDTVNTEIITCYFCLASQFNPFVGGSRRPKCLRLYDIFAAPSVRTVFDMFDVNYQIRRFFGQCSLAYDVCVCPLQHAHTPHTHMFWWPRDACANNHTRTHIKRIYILYYNIENLLIHVHGFVYIMPFVCHRRSGAESCALVENVINSLVNAARLICTEQSAVCVFLAIMRICAWAMSILIWPYLCVPASDCLGHFAVCARHKSQRVIACVCVRARATVANIKWRGKLSSRRARAQTH